MALKTFFERPLYKAINHKRQEETFATFAQNFVSFVVKKSGFS